MDFHSDHTRRIAQAQMADRDAAADRKRRDEVRRAALRAQGKPTRSSAPPPPRTRRQCRPAMAATCRCRKTPGMPAAAAMGPNAVVQLQGPLTRAVRRGEDSTLPREAGFVALPDPAAGVISKDAVQGLFAAVATRLDPAAPKALRAAGAATRAHVTANRIPRLPGRSCAPCRRVRRRRFRRAPSRATPEPSRAGSGSACAAWRVR